MSRPISARMTQALSSSMPGMVVRRRTVVRKGSTRASTSRSMSLITSSMAFDLLQMQAQQEAVMPGDAAAQRFAKRLGRRLDAAMRQPGQPLGIALAGNQGFDHLP